MGWFRDNVFDTDAWKWFKLIAAIIASVGVLFAIYVGGTQVGESSCRGKIDTLESKIIRLEGQLQLGSDERDRLTAAMEKIKLDCLGELPPPEGGWTRVKVDLGETVTTLNGKVEITVSDLIYRRDNWLKVVGSMKAGSSRECQFSAEGAAPVYDAQCGAYIIHLVRSGALGAVFDVAPVSLESK